MSGRSSGVKSRSKSFNSSFDPKNQSSRPPFGDVGHVDCRGKSSPQCRVYDEEADGSSRLKNNQSSRGRGRGRGRTNDAGKEIKPIQRLMDNMSGQKRKPIKNPATANLSDEHTSNFVSDLTIVVSDKSSKDGGTSTEVGGYVLNKKQRTSPSRSVDPAEAAEQPRQTQ